MNSRPKERGGGYSLAIPHFVEPQDGEKAAHTVTKRSSNTETESQLSRTEEKQQEFESSSDFANYFCSYEYIYHQKQMLEDRRRMSAYYDAIRKNPHHFKQKVIAW